MKALRDSRKLSKTENKTLKQFHSSEPAAYGSFNNLQNSSEIRRPKGEPFYHAKDEAAKNWHSEQELRRSQTNPYNVNEISFDDLAYVDNLPG